MTVLTTAIERERERERENDTFNTSVWTVGHGMTRRLLVGVTCGQKGMVVEAVDRL